MRTCTQCGEAKPPSGFYKRPNKGDGLNRRCKDCVRSSQLAYSHENREAEVARCKAYYAANKDRWAEYRPRDAERMRTDPEYRARYNEMKRKRYAERYREDPEYRARRIDLTAKRNQRKPEDQTFSRLDIYERDNGICRLCGEPVSRDDFHLDHIVPRKLDGVHRPENVQIAHPVCNLRKQDKLDGQIKLPV